MSQKTRILTKDDDESSDECAFGIQAKVTKIHNKLPYYDITINGKKTKILIDTGSSINIIDEDTLGKINLKPKLDEPKTKLMLTDSRKITN